jgi:hypothetical protein
MAIYHAAFDESGKADREAVVFAGLIAPPGLWNKQRTEWMTLLERAGLTYWRTTDAAHLSGPFKRFRNSRKDLEKLTLDLADVICGSVDGGTVHTITMEAYKRLPDQRREDLKDPLYAAFDAGLENLVGGPHVGLTDTVVLVYDDAEEYASECLSMYRRFKKLHPQIGGRIIGLCFHDGKFTPSLQAADMFAFVYRRKAECILTGIWSEVMDKFNATFSDQSQKDINA